MTCGITSVTGPDVTPDANGSPVPAGTVVFRLCGMTNDGKVPPEAFQLSTEDKAQAVPRLSVWAESLTTPAQANDIAGGRYSLAGFLPADSVRRLRPDPDDPTVEGLEVEWERAMTRLDDGAWVPCDLPGSIGHCGVARLDRPAQKRHRKSLYAALARLASGRVQRLD